MSDEAGPLHVRVAEALGWSNIRPCGDIAAPWASGHEGLPPGSGFLIGHASDGRVKVPRFDHPVVGWEHTGPLIERLKVTLERVETAMPDGEWIARGSDYFCTADGGHEGTASYDGGKRVYWTSPLVAVCRLILRLKETGKL